MHARPKNPEHSAPPPDAYAVIGNPIAQSLSPQIHTRFAEAAGQRLTYGRMLGRIGHFAEDVAHFRRAGGRGLNVTAPFKRDALACATRPSAAARLAGAANALHFVGDDILAQNFDGAGLVRDVQHNLGRALRDQRVLLLGAGGAARGVLLPLLQEAPQVLLIANRTARRAQELAALVEGPVEACALEELASACPAGGFDVVFQATSGSLHGPGDALPLPPGLFAPGALAYDLNYGAGAEPFLGLARAAGVQRLADGTGMLVEQAALAFAWWRGVHPATEPIIRQLVRPFM